jgi:plasmid stabilization system protein ParE
MSVIFSPAARRDLNAALQYLAHENPDAARRFIDRLDRVLGFLADGDLDGPSVRLQQGGQAHRWPVPPFRLYYRRTHDRLVVLRVYHGARRPIEQ